MWIKICANTNVDDALLAVGAGADAVGFVFAASKRQVTAAQVAVMMARLPETVMKIGVFTSTDAGEIVSQAAEAGLDAVQLHSRFNADLVNAIGGESGAMLKVIQVIDVAENAGVEEIRAGLLEALEHPYVFAVLLDASHGGASGGTGKPFDWDRLASTVRTVQEETGGRVIVAGGLRPENVAEAIARFAPWGVDVASGVEASPGKKDSERLRAFVAAARLAKARP